MFYGFTYTKEMQKLMAGPMFQQIIEDFDFAISGQLETHEALKKKRLAKMYAYSGHDTTISPVLYVLGLYDHDKPIPFNSVIMFELHLMPGGNALDMNSYYVEVIFLNSCCV